MAERRGLHRLWDVKPGEGARAGLMFANLLLLIAAYTTTKAVRDSVFLSRFGLTELSYTMIGIAIVAGFVVSLFTRATAGAPRDRLILGTNGFIAATLIVMAIGLRAGWGWLSWALYFWSGVFGLLVVAEFWLLANDLFHAREAKRLFALIGAGGILGGVVGGALSGWLARPLGTSNLLYLVAAELMGAAVLSHFAWRLRPTEIRAVETRGRPRFAEGVALVRKSRYVRMLALMMICMTVCMTIVQWQYKGIAKAHFGGHRDEMTAFFGGLAAILSAVSFVLQLVATPRLLRRFGVWAGLRVLPGGFLVGATVLGASALLGGGFELWAAAGAVLLSDTFRFSVDKASVELLYVPLPRPMKDQAKPFIDTVVDRFAGALAGFVWLFLTWAVHIDQPSRIGYASLVTIALVALWLAVIARTRGGYVEAYRRMLEPERPAPREHPRARACEEVLRCAFHADSPTRTQALRTIGRLQRCEPRLQLPRDRIEPLLGIETAEVTLLAHALRAEGAEPLDGKHAGRSLLVRLLSERLQHALERIARLLALVYPPRDILAAHRALSGASPGARAGALELLDNLLEGDRKGELLQALDDAALGSSRRRIVGGRARALEVLLDSDDRWLRAVAAWTAQQDGLLAERLAALALDDPDALVREAAGGSADATELDASGDEEARC